MSAARVLKLQHPMISEIDATEHEDLLDHLTHIEEKDMGEITIRAGKTKAGTLVVLVNTAMTGKFLAITAI